MIGIIIYLIISLSLTCKSQAMILYNFNNNSIGFKTSIFLLRSKNLLRKKIRYPEVGLRLKGLFNLNKYLSTFVLSDINLSIKKYINNNDYSFIDPKMFFWGLKDKKYGSISYGKNYGVIFNVERYVENTPIIRLNSRPMNYMLYKANKVLTYKNQNLFNIVKGLDIYLQKQFESKENEKKPLPLSTRLSNGDGYGFSFQYKVNTFLSIAGAYLQSERTTNQVIFDLNNVNDNASAYSLGFKIKTDNLYISSIYGTTYNITPYGNFLIPSEDKDKNITIIKPLFYGFSDYAKNTGIVAQYKFKTNLIPTIGYFQSKVYMSRDINNHDLIKYVELGINYKLKNISTYLNYKLNLLKPDTFIKKTNMSCRDKFNIGFNYVF